MINDTKFIANITRYRNYLQQPNNWCKPPVATFSKTKLLRLFVIHYKNHGNFIYKIEVKQ